MKLNANPLHALMIFAACMSSTSAMAITAGDDDPLITVLENGSVIFDARYRFENVQDRFFAEDANALTLRTRLGYRTGDYRGFSALLEFSNTTIAGDGDFNDTFNSKTNRAVVADAPGTAINRAFLQYDGFDDTVLAVGRQTLTLDNERFLSNDNFRQKQQTFDAFYATTTIVPRVKATYAYIWQVNGVLSPPGKGTATSNNIVNVAVDVAPFLKLVGYAYLLDFGASANSANTFGAHAQGEFPFSEGWSFFYQADYAHETAAYSDPLRYDFNYFLVEPGIRYGDFSLKGGVQQFEGSGFASFQTPLGDAHPYSGWADVFAVTPADGLQELYAEAGYTCHPGGLLDSVRTEGQYHSFDAERGNAHFGNEWDGGIYLTFARHYTASIEYSHFAADGSSVFRNVDKFWGTLGVAF